MIPLCTNGHPLTMGTTYRFQTSTGRTRVDCKVCHRIRGKEARAKKRAETPDHGFTLLEMRGRKPKQCIDVQPSEHRRSSFGSAPSLPVPLHRQALDARKADPDVARYYEEREAALERQATRDAEHDREWAARPHHPPRFKDFASAPSRDGEVRRLAT